MGAGGVGAGDGGGDGDGCPDRLFVGAGRLGGDGHGAGGDVGGARVDGSLASGGESIELGELGVRGGQADLQPLGFAEPPISLSLGYPLAEVATDLDQAGPLGWVGAKEGAAQAAVFVDAGGRIGTATVPQSNPATF